MTRYFRFTNGGIVWPEREVRDGDRPNAKQVVVIDFEDREQVALLQRLLWRAHGNEHAMAGDGVVRDLYIDKAQAALREFANPTPPKPDEPTGLGAVVEDARGKRWTRVKDGFNWRWRDDHLGEQTAWEHLVKREVRVLNHGWHPEDEAVQS